MTPRKYMSFGNTTLTKSVSILQVSNNLPRRRGSHGLIRLKPKDQASLRLDLEKQAGLFRAAPISRGLRRQLKPRTGSGGWIGGLYSKSMEAGLIAAT